MRLLSRDFTVTEKVILLILTLVLMGLAYYQFIDQPIRNSLEEAQAQKDALQMELDYINLRIKDYENRVYEIQQLRELGRPMPSYNSSERELSILNNILKPASEFEAFLQNITLNGDQIRRGFTLNFKSNSFETVKGIFTRLSNSPIRCLVGSVECSGIDAENSNIITVKADGTFYETKVNAVMDAALMEAIQAATEAAAETTVQEAEE